MKISELAKQKIIERNKENLPYFRLSVRGGGCSGMTYEMEYVDHKLESDYIVCESSIIVIYDPKSMMLLGDSYLDWTDSLMHSGFVWDNPIQKSTCSCGKSFSV